MADINIPFNYEKEITLKSEKVFTNLKWLKFEGTSGVPNLNRVEKFIETLLILIRNKVLMEGGDLENTDLVWFYPSSMSMNHVSQFRRTWTKLYKKYLNELKEPYDFSESEVPFYDYDPNEVISYDYPVINIDIGGGTTDIVLFERDKPKLLTSIKFAGNTVFGDGYSNSITNDNGFVSILKPNVEIFLDQNRNELSKLHRVFKQLDEPGRSTSADMMAFFFSLENNKEIKEKNLSINISEILANHEELNIVFIVFFGSIIYHIAKIMNRLGIKMPRNICFSGNGSKIIRLLDSNQRLEGVEQLSKIIFEKVYDELYHSDGLRMIQGQNPKEATSKGGIKKFRQGITQNKFDKVVLLGDVKDNLINVKSQNYARQYLKYDEITEANGVLKEAYKEDICQEMKDFLDLLFGIQREFDFNEYFGIETANLNYYKSILLRDLGASLEQGLKKRLELTNSDKDVEESLFFYPLVSSLYRLTQEIARAKA